MKNLLSLLQNPVLCGFQGIPWNAPVELGPCSLGHLWHLNCGCFQAGYCNPVLPWKATSRIATDFPQCGVVDLGWWRVYITLRFA